MKTGRSINIPVVFTLARPAIVTPMLARYLLITLACALCLAGCGATAATPKVQRIALLAPFEGRYREIGYNALYAAR
ncbi:MAG: hypothetical protein IAE89_10635, partial [Anaerolineae bacterium]|nr:hypothetical protein [Anaerolineae bacterium]